MGQIAKRRAARFNRIAYERQGGDRVLECPSLASTDVRTAAFEGNADIKNYDCVTGVTAGPVSLKASFATMAGSARFGETVQQKTVVRP